MGIISLLPAIYFLRHAIQDVAGKLELLESRVSLAKDEHCVVAAKQKILNDLKMLTNTGSFARPLSLFREE